MKKRLSSMLLVLVMMLGMLPATALAASSEAEALGEASIYNGGQKLSYLSINGRVRELIYTYFNYMGENGKTKEIPAYCVNPNTKGVPQTVASGQSIKYLAEEKGNDPKVMGIIANGYPTRGLAELKLENKYHAYYATKMALWCYLLPNWNINNLKVNPNLTGTEFQRAQAILTAAKDIYVRGTAWSKVYSPRVTATPDRDAAYATTVNGQQYKQQVFTIHSDTWVCNYAVRVAFTDPSSIPAGTRIVDMDNNDITTITTSSTGDGYAGKFKVLYPASAVAGKTGSVQLSFVTEVYKYAVFYATCAEVGKYGQLQNYMCDTDPTTTMKLSTYSNYSDGGEVEPPDTGLKITKLEKGTDTPLSGAVFEVVDPDGATVGTFATGADGTVTIPLTLAGNYTVYERVAPLDHLLSDNPAQNIKAEYGKMAELTYWNEPYGTLRIEKLSDTGAHLPGAMVQIKHIESGVTYTAETNFAGYAIFDNIRPGAYEIKEITAPSGWLKDDATYTATVSTGEMTTFSIVNKELPGLRIIKYDRKNMVAMSGVTFEVWRDGVSLGKFRTDEFGEILLTDVAPGTYRTVEVDTGSDGHILDTTPQEVELSAGDGIKELLFFNDVKPGLRLVKVDSTDPSKVIPNAVFEIKSVAGDYGPKEFTTDQNGEIDLSKLPTGAYVVTEKSCEGYVIDQAQRIIQLAPNEDAQFVFTNTIKPALQIIKTSSDGSRLKNVSFRIARIEDGTHYLDRMTNEQGEILISDLEPGVYSVRETSTDSSHILDLREYHVELFPGKTSTLTIIMIDAEREYGELTRALQGSVLEISPSSPHHINPLDINRGYGAGENPVAMKSELMMSICEQQMGVGQLGAYHKSIIDRCTANIYHDFIKSGGEGQIPTLPDWRNEVKRQPEREAQELALASELFVEGSLNMFAHETNFDIDNRIICFDLYEMGEQLKPTALNVVLETIQNRVAANRLAGRYTWVFVDEVYLFFKYYYSAQFLYKCWKRFRKYAAAMTAATQNIEECLHSETARLMLANSEFLILLNQAATDRAELAKLLHISETQMSHVTNVEAGHGLMRIGSSIIPFVNEFPRDGALYRLMTTTPGDK